MAILMANCSKDHQRLSKAVKSLKEQSSKLNSSVESFDRVTWVSTLRLLSAIVACRPLLDFNGSASPQLSKIPPSPA